MILEGIINFSCFKLGNLEFRDVVQQKKMNEL